MSDTLFYMSVIPGIVVLWIVAAVIFIGGVKEVHKIIRDWRR